MKSELERLEILGDFVLCVDDTENFTGCKESPFFHDEGDATMKKENLRIFKIVKLPHNQKSYQYDDGLLFTLGDRVISIGVGITMSLDGGEYKMFEMQYITAKVEE